MSHHSSFEYDTQANRQRILVVDDDPLILRLVDEKLSKHEYDVFSARGGEEALAVIERRGLPHLAIVDILMPGMDGFDFCQAVHRYSDLPIILLTAVDHEETVVRGITEYAEDYITKPFSLRELVARVERVLRRFGDFSFTLGPLIEVDDCLAVDFPRQRAIVEGSSVDLTPTETKLLYVLMRNGRQTVTTEFLLRRLWPLDRAFPDTLRVHVCRLRDKIEADSGEPRYIVTERGVGYRFAAQH